MRLDDINNYLDVQHACARLAKRIDGINYSTDLQFDNITDFTEAARLTDCSIKREVYSDGKTTVFKFSYRGVEFWYMGHAGEAV